MKAITLEYTEDDDGQEVLESEEVEDLSSAISKALDSVDYYQGRDIETVVSNLSRSFARLVTMLAERNMLNVNDLNQIIPALGITDIDEDDDDGN